MTINARRPARGTITFLFALGLAACLALPLAHPAAANTSHAGWPPITGMLEQAITGGNRHIDGRPGHDPSDHTSYSGSCHPLIKMLARYIGWPLLRALSVPYVPVKSYDEPFQCGSAIFPIAIVPPWIGHNELLGGHANDTIHAGPAGDVIWGDYKPSGQPSTQIDHLYGGPGNDFIYTSHGANIVHTGGGHDIVHAHFGHGEIYCDSPTVTVYIVHYSPYKLHGCHHISHYSLGY